MAEEVGFIAKFFDKPYETKSILELAKAPVAAISGISKEDAINLKKTLGIETVEDLIKNRYVQLARGLNFFSACSGEILDKKFMSEEYKKLSEKPISAISGISDSDAALLKKAFGINSIKDLAESKYVEIAEVTVKLAYLVQFLAQALADPRPTP
jgi:predicted RecB family nuclease